MNTPPGASPGSRPKNRSMTEVTPYTGWVKGTSSGRLERGRMRWPSCAPRVWLLSLAAASCGSAAQPASDTGLTPDAPADTVHAPDVTHDPDALDVPPDETDAAALPTEDAQGGPDNEAAPTCSGICNSATPIYPTVGPSTSQGNVTMYTTEASNGGACNYGVTQVMYFAAVNVNMVPGDGLGQWQGGRICGQCIEVTAFTSQGPQSVVVRILDKCPDGYCGIDLGGAAPAAIMRDGFGRYDGTWRLVTCAGHPEVSDGPTSLAVLGGANAYWSRVHVSNPPSAVSALDWQDAQGSGSFPYASDPENTFAVPTEVLQSSAASLAITAHFRDDSAATVTLTPAQLAAGGGSYAMH